MTASRPSLPLTKPMPVADARRPRPARSPLDRLPGSPVVVQLRSGQVLSGKYLWSSRYEIEILTDEGRVVVFKHAVDWIRAVG